MSGYFFAALKSGGLRIQPWTLRPSKLEYQNSSGSLWPISLNSASLRLLERLGFQRVSLREAADEFKGRVSDEWTLRLDAAAFVRAADAQPALGSASADPQ